MGKYSLRITRYLGLLADLRTLRGSYYKLFDYLQNEVYPNLKSKGLHAQAFIISDDIITAHGTGKLMDVLSSKH